MTPEPQITPTDEQLSAYLDGELDDHEADRIEQQAETDPELRKRIDRLAAVDHRLRAAFPVVPEEPAVARIAAKLKETSTVVPFPPRQKEQRDTGARRFVPALMAASLALLIGFGSGFLLRGPQETTAPTIAIGPVAKDTALATLLERSPTGSPIAIGEASHAKSVVVASTFKDRDGRPCREFETLRGVASTGAITAVGVACREEGRWVVRGVVALASESAAPSGITPSSNETKDALDALLTALGATQAMTPAEEAQILERAWR
jgi:hypothetical protein